MLVAYERKIGEQYLLNTLQQPLQEIAVLLEHCEINPDKLHEQTPDYSEQQLQEVLNWNTRNLESSCLLLFEAVFQSRQEIPARILALCCFINYLVRETMNQEKNIEQKFDLMRQQVDLGTLSLNPTLGKYLENENSSKQSTDNLAQPEAFGSKNL